MKILTIDDEYVSLQKMTRILSRWGVCEGATNGLQALEMVSSAIEATDPYDLITIDISMPEINGLDLLGLLVEKEKDLGGWHSRKIIVTADGNLENVKKAMENHCDAFIVKPVNPEILEKKVREIWATE